MKIRRNILLNPGPATTTDSVKRALVVPDICPRESEFGELMMRVGRGLVDIVHGGRAYEAILFAGSGTCAVEACISSVVAPAGRIAIINNGAYGARMVAMAKAHALPHLEIALPWGQRPDPTRVATLLRKDRRTTCLAMVHHETTTGQLNPLQAMGRVARSAGCTFVVDAMSSYAGIPIDVRKAGVDFLISSSNKCIQGMAGLSFVIARKAALEQVGSYPRRSVYLSLYDQYEHMRQTGQMQFTPPVQVVYALRQALREYQKEGGRRRYARYTRNWRVLRQGLMHLGFRFLLPEMEESHILTTVLEPADPHYQFDRMHDLLKTRGFTVYPGKIGSRTTFRLANMGDLHPADMKRFLTALRSVLRQMKVRLPLVYSTGNGKKHA